MNDACSPLASGAGFVSSMANYIDCQSQTLGSGAWQALATPGSTLFVVLSGFLTILIAIIGYNLLLGRSLTVRDATLTFVKIGAVFALATSWPAYRTLVYDVVVDGPGQLVSEIGPRAGVVGSDGTLLQRLDLADYALAQLAILGAGNPPASANLQLPPPPIVGFEAFALGGSRLLFLLAALGGLGAVRIVTGLMLALGPFFIAFLLFENTRSLFEGWVRVLAGAALGGVGISIALGLELAFLEPWLSDVLARRMAGEALPTISSELFVISCLFAILIVAALFGCARVARGFRLAPLRRPLFAAAGQSHTSTASMTSRVDHSVEAASERSRAAAVASVLLATSRRDQLEPALFTSGVAAQGSRTASAMTSVEAGRLATPVGRSFRRRPNSRVSAMAARRDTGA
jgi:type IV secretion system protein VirB6